MRPGDARGRARSVATAGAVAALLLVLGGCGGSDESGSDLPEFRSGATTSSPSVVSSTTSAAPTSSAVGTSAYPDAVPVVTEGEHGAGPSADPLVAAVVDYQQALSEALYAGAAPDDLAQRASGQALADVIGRVRDYIGDGWTLRGGLVLAVNEASITGRTATATGCMKDSTMAFKEGQPVETPRTTYFAFTTGLQQKGSTWTVDTFSVQARGVCAV